MSVYFVANICIHNQEEYDKYLASVDDVFVKFKGKYLAVDEHPTILEGEWRYTKAVMIRFPSEESFRDWYESDEYQSILKNRLQGAQCDTILIHGYE